MYICSKFMQLHVHLSSMIYNSFISHTLDDMEQIYLMCFAVTKCWYYSICAFTVTIQLSFLARYVYVQAE